MNAPRPDLNELTGALLGAFPELDDEKRRIALATYRRLARGTPAASQEIAADAGVDPATTARVLDEWIGVFTDGDRRVVGFWGLAIAKMKHRFEVDGVHLHTWCAWDTLFLPELLGKTARVESACASSGEPVRLTVSPRRIERVEPSAPVVSFLAPNASRFREGIVESFCHYIHFFRSHADGEAWIAQHPGTFLLTLDEAVELARRKNHAQFGRQEHRS